RLGLRDGRRAHRHAPLWDRRHPALLRERPPLPRAVRVKIPYRWLRELVETGASPQQAAERLTMAGIEGAGVTAVVTGLTGVVVGEVTGVAPHPAGGSLTVCQVSGGRETVGVVCGAPNVRAGVRAAFAPPGAVLPGGRRIEAATIKGVVSHG